MNVVEPIFAQSRNKPSELALCAPGTEFNLVSYARLERRVNNVCGRILSAGIAPRSRIAVLIDDPILHILIVIALTRLGIVTVFAGAKYLQWPFKLDAAIADREYESLAGQSVIIADAGWAEGDGQPTAKNRIYDAAPNDPCGIFLTYGSDRRQTAVAITHGMMANRIERQKLLLGRRTPFCDRTYLDLPLGRPIGFQVMIDTLRRGGALVMTGHPQKMLTALTSYRIQNIIAAPRSLLNLAGAVGDNLGWCSSLIAVFSLRGMGPDATTSIRTRLCSNLTIGYVASDGTMVASTPVPVASGTPGATGHLLPGVMAEIVDDNDRVLPSGFEGNLRIRSEYGVKEFFEDPEATRRVFRNGWFYPGDRGHLTAENLLVLSGKTAAEATMEDEL